MGEGEGGIIWENGIEICIISYMKRVASPGLMHDTGCLGLVHWDNPEGWYGEEVGGAVQDGDGVPRGPATSTGSLASQRHPGKLPKVPGRRRGMPGSIQDLSSSARGQTQVSRTAGGFFTI